MRRPGDALPSRLDALKDAQASPGRPRRAQETPKGGQQVSRVSPEAARRGPGAPKTRKTHGFYDVLCNAQGAAQSAPRGPQELPRSPQDAPRTRPEGPQNAPKSRPEAPRSRQEVLRRHPGATKRPPRRPRSRAGPFRSRQDAPRRPPGAAQRPQGGPQEPPKNASCHDHGEVRPQT